MTQLKQFCFLVLLSAAAGFSGSIGIGSLQTRHVEELYNNLTSWDATFTVHCKSKDDDLGTQVVPRGQTYKFKFKTNVGMTTLFFCRVAWEKGSGTYNIYKAHWDTVQCPDLC